MRGGASGGDVAGSGEDDCVETMLISCRWPPGEGSDQMETVQQQEKEKDGY